MDTIPVNSHPRLDWLRSIRGARSVPAHVVRQISGLIGVEYAQAFVKGAGLEVVDKVKRFTRSANSVTLLPPAGIDEYYGSQIVIPKIDCEEVPLGSALLNCLVPALSDFAWAEKVFSVYQGIVKAFSIKLEALPCACITGYKAEDPLHDLYLRGFRFFFSPQPEKMLASIRRILDVYQALRENGEMPTERRDLAKRVQELKHCRMGEELIGHSLLEDIKPMTTETLLVRFDE